MAISINQISAGMGLMINNDICIVIDSQHVKPGKGPAFARVKVKNIKTGNVLEKTFRDSDKPEKVDLEERKLQYLYRAGDDFHFMDQVTFEEQVLTLDDMGDAVNYLLDDMEVQGTVYQEKVLRITMPTFIIAKITKSDPGLKGDSSRSGNKPATIETGATIQVPLFVETDDIVKVDTRTGEYVERVKK